MADPTKEEHRIPSAPPEGAGAVVPGTSAQVDTKGPEGRLPVPVGPAPVKRRRWVRALLVLAVLGLAAGGGAYWWLQTRDQLPAGIVWSNGRIEADQIDIDTKFAGRLAQLLVDEGDMVKAGEVVARMDTQDLETSLRRAEAQAQQAHKVIDEANAAVAQQQAQVKLAQQELERTQYLVQRGNATKELLDQRQQQLASANALLNAANARVSQAQHALIAAQHDADLYRVNIADNTLRAPRDGRVQYRVANVGEVLPAGGKVVTILDLGYVYMDVYLPTLDAGRVKVGADARIVLDAYPNLPIPAKVSFVADQSQFTPKTVETRTERDRLMFRVRVRVPPDLLRAHADAVRSGLPGVTYVKIDPKVEWPARLQGTLGR